MDTAKTVKLGASSIAALAAGIGAVHADEAPAVGGEFDGFYAGVSTGWVTGDLPMKNSDHETYSLHGFTPGLFMGFNSQHDMLVFGAEAAFSGPAGTNDSSQGSADFGEYKLNYSLDAKAKVGVATDKIMVYGFIGSSAQTSTIDYDMTYAAYGVNFGAGVDLKATDHVTVGVEYIQRRMDVEDDVGPAGKLNNGAWSLRLAYNF